MASTNRRSTAPSSGYFMRRRCKSEWACSASSRAALRSASHSSRPLRLARTRLAQAVMIPAIPVSTAAMTAPSPDTSWVLHFARSRAVEGGSAERQHATVGGEEPVAVALGVEVSRHDRSVERLPGHATLELGGTEREHASVLGDEQVAVVLRAHGHVADGRSQLLAAHRAEEPGIAIAEHATVSSDDVVAVAGLGANDLHGPSSRGCGRRPSTGPSPAVDLAYLRCQVLPAARSRALRHGLVRAGDLIRPPAALRAPRHELGEAVHHRRGGPVDGLKVP